MIQRDTRGHLLKMFYVGLLLGLVYAALSELFL